MQFGINLVGKFVPDCMVSLSCAIKMEATHSSETAVNFYQTTYRCISEESIQLSNYFENLRSQLSCLFEYILFCQWKHVQDIMESWSSHLNSCGLILYRAVGHNRNVLFGGRNPPLNKTDTRLRTIPFATRRATFTEVRRVHDILTSVEMYGMLLYVV